MNIQELIAEYGIETDDIRWYLSSQKSYELLQFINHKDDLTEYINSGRLEEELYNMEESYVLDLQDLADRGKIDEVNVREEFNNIIVLKKRRYK